MGYAVPMTVNIRRPLVPTRVRAKAKSRRGRGVTEVTSASVTGPSRARPSIAVVPFRVEGDGETKSYFGEGIVEDIVGALASLRELLVISRSSTLRYGGAPVDVRAVGRELSVS